MYTYTCMHCVYICKVKCIHACMHTCIPMYAQLHTHAYTCTCLRVCLPCRAASPRCGRGCTASKRSGGATTRTHGVGHTPGRRPQALGSLLSAGVAMLHWFCTSALSTCGSVLLCSIVYYPRDGFYVLSVECGFHSVQIKCCSIYAGQDQHGRACCEA